MPSEEEMGKLQTDACPSEIPFALWTPLAVDYNRHLNIAGANLLAIMHT